MNAEILIKARKVFVKEPIEFSETCPYCASKGVENKLRYYYISLEEAIYKCAGATCLYPFQRFIFKSLVDNSTYYYEEVLEGGREAIFRVSLDDQPIYQAKNPLSTKEFCDSQREPNIESYSCDFSDLLNDLEPEPEHQAQSESSTVNPDFLEFLDDISPVADHLNEDKVLDKNGVVDLIDNLLKESPAKSTTPMKPLKVKAESSKKSKAVATDKAKSEPKLSKCIQHIEKAKSSKNQKSREKSAETFSMAIRKARKSQTKAKTDLVSPVKTESEPESEPEPQQVQSQQPKSEQVSATKNLTTALKSAKILRPTALAKQLSSMDFTKIDSAFLRQYMKSKEDKLFEGEPSGDLNMNSENGASKKNVESVESSAKCETMTGISCAESKTKKPTKTTKPTKKGVKKELPSEIEGGTGLKKENLPRSTKAKSTKKDAKTTKVKVEQPENPLESVVVMKQEPASKTMVKEEKPPRKRPTSKRKNTEQKMTDADEKKNVHEMIGGELKPPAKKEQIPSTVTSDNSTAIESSSKKRKRSSVKRTKADDVSVKVEDGDPKPPKRRRNTKSTKNSNKDDPPSVSPILESGSESKSNVQQNANLMILPPMKPTMSGDDSTVSDRSSSVDLEGSTFEPLLGFGSQPPDVENVKRQLVFEEVTPAQKSAKKRSIGKKPKDVKTTKLDSLDDSSKSSSTKRPRGRGASSKPSGERPQNQAKPKRVSKPRKETVVKSNTDLVTTQLPDLSHPSETKENVQQELTSTSLQIQTDNAIVHEPIAIAASPNEITCSNKVATETNGICLSTCVAKEQNSTSEPQQALYYVVKTQKKKEAKTFNAKKLLKDIVKDWEDSESEHTNTQAMTTERDSNIQENLDIDDTASVISIASETSDNSLVFVGEPNSGKKDLS